ncbi:DsrE family protein [Paeniroseomonas aquatica]|uniref:DsrE family protein n=1 Tax=Paeniroseomonas aquatica TaxID=373043 RepID=A0ABT8A5R2_9PROT|nr:DsrE family protein [Paeniroseomonas aquatica]MDN3565097.1 DsrE family protein [Paeniroseomonas aquatica]
MTNLGRRGLSGLIAAGGVLAVQTARAAPKEVEPRSIEKEADAAAAYHLDFGDPKRYSQMLDNARNHLAAYDYDTMALRIVFVAHAAGIKFFLKTLDGTPWAGETLDPDFVARLNGIAAFGLQVLLCRLTFEKNNIPLDQARTEAWIQSVPSGIATVSALQNKGFSYIKIG